MKQEFSLDNSYVWNYEVTYLLVLFQNEKLSNYELDYYAENKDVLLEMINSVEIK